MERAPFDLNVRTRASFDSTLSLAAYVEAANQAGMNLLAVADYATIDSWPLVTKVQEAMQAQGNQLRIMKGVLLPMMYQPVAGHRMHKVVEVVCYGWPASYLGQLTRLMTRYTAWLRASAEGWVTGLQAFANYWNVETSITEQDLAHVLGRYRDPGMFALQGLTPVRRSSMVRFLDVKGMLRAPSEYESKLLPFLAKGEFLPPPPLASEIIPNLKRAGVTLIIAAPHQLEPNAHFIDSALRSLYDATQFDGVECASPETSEHAMSTMLAWCRKRNLFTTAGSWCRDSQDVMVKLGFHGGQRDWLDSFLERVQQ